MSVIADRVIDKTLLKQGPVAYPHVVPEGTWSRGRRVLGPIASEHPASKRENADGAPPLIRPKWTSRRRLSCLIISGGAVRSPISPVEWNQLHRRHAGRHGTRPSDLVHAQVSDGAGL